MHASVLVAYGTKNGSTAGIAEAVADVLNKAGVTAEALPAATVPDVKPYGAVVIGGALYAGHWQRDARRFLGRHRRALAGRPVWLFSSGPLDASASERDIPPVPGVRRAMIRLDARGHTTFGGCLGEDAEGRLARSIVRGGKGGDFRDFAAIEAWAAGIADELLGLRNAAGAV
ncbi:flavodoxin domain-containing protein [Streptomyces sp. NPDC091280]|uniref:flavodoxin domain-containing protein n=1 Tax=Streptomyces sp. NPDC091280 TaxID=3365984 RepID=UPI003804A4A2